MSLDGIGWKKNRRTKWLSCKHFMQSGIGIYSLHIRLWFSILLGMKLWSLVYIEDKTRGTSCWNDACFSFLLLLVSLDEKRKINLMNMKMMCWASYAQHSKEWENEKLFIESYQSSLLDNDFDEISIFSPSLYRIIIYIKVTFPGVCGTKCK